MKEADLDPQKNVINIFGAMGGKSMTEWELFCDDQSCDACHPNDSGYTYMASKIYGKLFGKAKPTGPAGSADGITYQAMI